MATTDEFDIEKYKQLILKKKYLFVTTALLLMAGAVIASYIPPERYEAKCTVFIENSAIGELVKGIAITPSFEDKLRVLAYTLKSRDLLLKVFDDLHLDRNNGRLEDTIKDFQAKTDIGYKDREGLFTITFTSTNPRFARDFVNTLAQRYIKENTTAKREASSGASVLLAEQVAAVKTKLEETEARATSYRRDRGGVLGLSEAEIVAEISQAQQKIDEIGIQRRQLESMLSLARKNDPLKTKLAALKKKQQELELVYTDNHPDVIAINNEIAAATRSTSSGAAGSWPAGESSFEVEKLSMELNSLRDTENNQRRFIAAKQSLLRSIPAVKSGLAELERETNSQKNLYEQLMARYGQAEVANQLQVQDTAATFRIVDPALLPTRPVDPRRVKIILVGIVASLAASFGLLVLLDRLDASVRDIESLKSLGVQILAVVPTIKDPDELQASRKRDYWFYGVSAACFVVILLAIPLEILRSRSYDVFNPANMMTHVMESVLK